MKHYNVNGSANKHSLSKMDHLKTKLLAYSKKYM